MDTAIKHLVPDRVKQLFAIFDIWALLTLSPGAQSWGSRVPRCQKLQMTA